LSYFRRKHSGMKFSLKDDSRRAFMVNNLSFLGLLPLMPKSGLLPNLLETEPVTLQTHVFSKHLQFLDYKDMAAAAVDIGFDGVELTVRKKGHVLPENVEVDLPKAVSAIRKAGLLSKMMVTGITSVSEQSSKVLKTASDHSIQYYRLGYYKYPKDQDMIASIDVFKNQMSDLAFLNTQLGIQGGYQNHAGSGVGASMWEVWQILEKSHLQAMGSQYDIRHAIVEGGASWKNGLRLIHPRINAIVLKDFRWEKKAGKWRILNTPLGEGMVDFPAYFKLLKEYKINVPVSIHYEYDLDGAEHGDRDISSSSRRKVYKAMKKDLTFVHNTWKEA
jgi:L-ribulose-5-phosphate 3-epimerase